MITAGELCELIVAEWSDAMSDNGDVWSQAKRKLDEGLDRADAVTSAKAYEMAYESQVLAS
tara:strand:+ start:741 stop:923 length:183 start_codon:yes stop_codon:yes gene_type:complete